MFFSVMKRLGAACAGLMLAVAAHATEMPTHDVNAQPTVRASANSLATSCRLLDTGRVACAAEEGWPSDGVDLITTNNLVCLRTRLSDVWCRGDGAALTPSAQPWRVTGLDEPIVKWVASKLSVCVLVPSGRVLCWGQNDYGELGRHWLELSGSLTAMLPVAGLEEGAADIAAGDYHQCAVLTTGGVRCWGADTYDRLGDGPSDYGTAPSNVEVRQANPRPVNVLGLDGATPASLSAGWAHTCALSAEGQLRCWGSNGWLQLGAGANGWAWQTTASGQTLALRSVAAGSRHTCGVSQQGGVWCWGGNDAGELGNGDWRARHTDLPCISMGWGTHCELSGDDHSLKTAVAVPVAGLEQGFVRMQGSRCAIHESGTRWCWGLQGEGGQVPELAHPIVSAAALSDTDRVLNYLEQVTPTLLWPARSATLTLGPYRYRRYTDGPDYSYLGTGDGHLYYTGPLIPGGQLFDLGLLSTWLSLAQAAGY